MITKIAHAVCLLTCAVAMGILATLPARSVPTETEVATVATVETTEPTDTEPTEAETTPTATEATEPPIILYDVPLDMDLQLYIIQLCQIYEVDPAIVMGMIYRESGFRSDAVGDSGNSLGLMQIQPRWNSELMDRLNCPNLFDPYQNVTVGIHILAEKIAKHGDVGKALTAYNAGDSGAYKHYFSKGIYASKYAEAVMAYADEIR